MQQLFSIRTKNDRGQAFLAALRLIVDNDPTCPSQTDVVMRLVFEEADRIRKRKAKAVQ